jgi:Glycosyltransferase family 87
MVWVRNMSDKDRRNKIQQIVLPSIIAGIVAMLILVVGVWQSPAITVRAGHHDYWFFRQFYDVEQIGNQQMRWSQPTSVLRLPAIQGRETVVTLWLLNGRPGGTPAQQIRFSAPMMAPLDVIVAGWQLRRYAFLLPVQGWSWQTPLTLQARDVIVGAEQRSMGVLVAKFATSTPKTIAPYVGIVGFATGLAGACLLALHGIRRRRWLIGVPGIVSILLGLGVSFRPAECIPWLHWPVALILVALIWHGLVRILGWTQRQSDDTLSVAGQYLPVAFGLAWLLMPWVQVLLGWDDVYVRSLGMYPGWLLYFAWGGFFGGVVMMYGATWLHLPQVAQWLRQWFFLYGMAIVTMIYLVISWQGVMQGGSADFNVWMIAARHWLATGSLYDVPAIAADVFGYIYKYPPFYGMLFIPLAGFADITVLRMYRYIDIGLLVATALIWRSMIPTRSWWWWIPTMIICANLNPVLETLRYGQIDIVIALLCSICYWCLYHDRDDAAGWLIALMTTMKLYPIVLLGYVILRRRWRGVRGFAIGMVVFNVIGLAVVGWADYVTFVRDVMPIIGGTTAYVENQTIYAFVARLVAPSYPLAPFYDGHWTAVASVLALALIALSALVTMRDVPAKSSLAALQYGLFVMVMALAIPVAWVGYQVPLYLIWLMVVWYALTHQLSIARISILAMSFALIGFGNFLSFVFRLDVGLVATIIDSYKLYGMLALLVMMWVLVWQERASWAREWLADGQRLQAWMRGQREIK